ncbi:glycosyltransferase [Dyella japonica]|uniref:Glycosyl transferase n=1 Tax=Dyella japonica A8 TaxID=1217721 RepID=A0A075K2J4_9GAMM|nr:glycosyltransferase [Dyella japonica]AIF47932.1 glycosyl transferase [Dyella japonica A8]
MSKINLFVFAAHHLSNNIAAQRFKGLLKYLDPAKYRVFVFARGTEKAVPGPRDVEDGGVGVYALPGHCVGSESSSLTAMPILAAAFFRTLPFLVARSRLSTGQWLVSALSEADRLCREKLVAGERCIAIGTYSPVDSLIAAASLSNRRGVPCIQDFRDGLVFESLGRPGWLPGLVRGVIERRVVGTRGLITSVSGPLVDDFKRRYPDKPVAILPNGYDPADFIALDHDAERGKQAEAMLAAAAPKGGQLVGHFGRIGASDGSASKSLEYFVDAMNADEHGASSGRVVIFVGELTAFEREVLERARFPVVALGSVDRSLALHLMKRCDRLLLLTGSRASCATGKLFEYLAVGVDVVCVSGIRNAATAILAETKAGQAVLTSQGTQGALQLRRALAAPTVVDRRDIGAYSKIEQARVLDQWLSKAVLA